MRRVIDSIESEFRRYKALAEQAVDQVTDEQLVVRAGDGNSIAILLRHVSGNLRSRFTDFLTSDGEKPWRDRESEFADRPLPRGELLDEWNEGWAVLFTALAALGDDQLQQQVSIRGVPLTVLDALHRSVTHASYHVGQIVLLAKAAAGPNWRYLSIPPARSASTGSGERR